MSEKVEWSKIKQDLSEVNWSDLTDGKDVDQIYDTI